MIPAGATHKHQIYGKTYYYKRTVSYRMNEVSEQPMQETRWEYWMGDHWHFAGYGLRSSVFVEIKE